MADDYETVDKRLLQIASDVSSVEDSVVPRILVKLHAVLDSYPKGSRGLNKVKNDLWSLGLVQVALSSLKQEYGKILNGWELASRIASIICQTCASVQPADPEVFKNKSMPEIIQTILIAVRKIQAKFMKTSDILEDTKKDLLVYLKDVLDGIALLCSGPEYIAKQVLVCPWFLQLLLTDDRRSCIVVMGLLESIARMKPFVFGEIDEKLTHQIMDELVYKLSATSESDLAGNVCRTILTLCDCYNPMVEILCRRYKGLSYLLNAWKHKGFERDLYRLEQLLAAGNMRQAQLLKKHEAAMYIQAWWRSYHTRKKIKKAGTAFAAFQRSFRLRRKQRDEHKQTARMESDLMHILLMNRRKAMRSLQSRKLEALQILPAADVEKFLQQESTMAATQIQRTWRGYYTRKGNQHRLHVVTEIRAAILIQRTIRKWLERVRARRSEPPAWQRPPGLTDHRRVQLQQDILNWRENNQTQTKSDEGREELHYRVQDLIKEFAMTSRNLRRNQQKRDLLLKRIELDADMLMEAPKLSIATENDVQDYISTSIPIATKGRFNHNHELRLLRQPWWRKLGDEYQDSKYEEDNESWKLF